MKLGRRALAGAFLALLTLPMMLSPPAKADTPAVDWVTDWIGTTAVTGSLTYAQPLPGHISVCKWNLPFEFVLESPAFPHKTPAGVEVAPLTVRGTGPDPRYRTCSSEAASGASFTLSIHAGEITCTDIRAGFTMIYGEIQAVFGSPSGCTYNGAPAQSYGFLLEGFRLFTTGQITGVLAYGV
jgi:hypothetical protein